MPEPVPHNANVLNAVDYFKAKLQFESAPATLHHLLQEKGSLLVLDVRDAESFASEHIPGAVNIPLEEVPHRYEELPKDKTIVAYSWSLTCPMAAKAALELGHRGYKVQELMGGIYGWKHSGFSIEGRGRA